MTFLILATVASLLGFIPLVQSIPQLTFPVNAQVPPLAVVSQPFSFTFSPSTFSYDSPSISYTISNNTPSWLSFNASTRTFSGTPASSDVGNFTFTLSANDSTGTASGAVTFLVVQEDGVTVGETVATQLETFGGVDGNDGIVLNDQKVFTWQFAQDTFKTSNIPIATYYAVSTGHTPLPSWIKFSSSNLTFSGAAPQVFSQIAPPQYFSISLIASTHFGFASSSQSFNVIIGAHALTIDPTTIYVNTTIGTSFNYTFSLSSVSLDGQPIQQSNVSFITADLGENGSWLHFDNTTLVLSGQPSKGDKGSTVELTIQDVFADVVRATIQVDLYDGLFTTVLPSIYNATIGKEFTLVLNNSYFAASDVQVTVDFKAQDGDNWLSYDSGTRTISGTPEADKAKSVSVDINASSSSLNEKQTASFTVQSVSLNGTVILPATSSSSSNKSLAIGLGVSLPLAALIFLCGGAYLYRRRKKTKKTSIRSGSPPPQISRPYNTTPDSDWPLEERKSWGEPRQLGGMDLFKRGVSGMFTIKTSEVGTTGANVGHDGWNADPEQEKALPTPVIGGPRELPRAAMARGSWRRGDGRDWVSAARSSDASLATVSTNEIFSVRLVQSPNPNNGTGAGGLTPMSPGVGGVSPLLGGMGIRGAAPVVNVHPPPDDRAAGGFGERSQDTIGSFSEGSSGVDYEGTTWESADRMFPRSPRQSLGHWKNNMSSHYSADSFQSGYGEENQGRGTWYQKRESSKDTIEDAVEYPVSRVSGPLSPLSPNLEWSGGSGQPGRPRLVELASKKRVESTSSSGHGSGEVAFV